MCREGAKGRSEHVPVQFESPAGTAGDAPARRARERRADAPAVARGAWKRRAAGAVEGEVVASTKQAAAGGEARPGRRATRQRTAAVALRGLRSGRPRHRCRGDRSGTVL